ncbi:ATPase [Mycolicibacterium moriokaense]|nr:ATPase [Mycolicibacterium moriokaense]
MIAEVNAQRSTPWREDADSDNATAWYTNITTVRWETPKPAVPGSRFAFTARFLGRQLNYTYEVTDLVPGQRFAMRTAQGPFPMETLYSWADAPGGTTLMTLCNRGDPSGFSRLVRPFLASAIKRVNRKDLERLKSILEGH